jgi:hypothetical protein
MRAVGHFAILALLLVLAGLLIVGGSLLVAHVGTDWAEGGGLFSIIGMGGIVVGVLLASGSIILLRGRLRSTRPAASTAKYQ